MSKQKLVDCIRLLEYHYDSYFLVTASIILMNCPICWFALQSTIKVDIRLRMRKEFMFVSSIG